jgi:hypothetical protein
MCHQNPGTSFYYTRPCGTSISRKGLVNMRIRRVHNCWHFSIFQNQVLVFVISTISMCQNRPHICGLFQGVRRFFLHCLTARRWGGVGPVWPWVLTPVRQFADDSDQDAQADEKSEQDPGLRKAFTETIPCLLGIYLPLPGQDFKLHFLSCCW